MASKHPRPRSMDRDDTAAADSVGKSARDKIGPSPRMFLCIGPTLPRIRDLEEDYEDEACEDEVCEDDDEESDALPPPGQKGKRIDYDDEDDDEDIEDVSFRTNGFAHVRATALSRRLSRLCSARTTQDDALAITTAVARWCDASRNGDTLRVDIARDVRILIVALGPSGDLPLRRHCLVAQRTITYQQLICD